MNDEKLIKNEFFLKKMSKKPNITVKHKAESRLLIGFEFLIA